MTRPRPALLLIVVSALALGVGTVGVATAGSGQHVEAVGSRAAIEPAGHGIRDSAASENRPVPRATRFRSLGRTDATELPRPDRTPRPVRIRIPALDVDADIDVVGIDTDGQVTVPYDVRRAGWYRFGSKPGADTGSTVIVGHRDGVDQGAGAFVALGELGPGDEITVDRADGSLVRYEVVARESFAKSAVPWRDFFSRTGPARLTLITCGGPFDPSALSYTDNIVVTALPIDGVAITAKSGQTR